jgi:fibronectin-binding autotransporter adhesin
MQKRIALFTALLGVCSFIQVAQAQNATNNYTGPSAGSLLTPGNWSLGHVPSVTEDAVFTANPGIRTLTAGNLTVGSFNITASTGTFSIRNETSTSTNSTLTLGGVGNLGNGVSGTTADLLFAATGSTFAIRGDNLNGTGVLKLVLGQSSNFDAAGTINISASISDGGSGFGITKTGAGTLMFSGINTYSGGTTLNAGQLNINSATALGTGLFTIAGVSTIDSTVSPFGPLINNNAMAWNGDFTFAGTNSLDLGNGAVSMNATRQITVNSNNLTAGGVISGTGFGVTKQGAGNLTLNGLNSYSGVTTINNGTITANTLANGGSNSSIGSSSNIASNLVINGGVLNYDSGSASSTNRLFTIGSSGAIIQNNSSSSAFTVNFTNTSAITVSGTTDRTLTLRGLNTGDNTLSAALIDPSSPGKLSVTKDNLGTWILAGNNTYTGATTVNSGALLINGSTATGSAVTVNNSGTTLGGGGTIGGTVSVASGSHLSPGTTSAGNTATLNTGALTLSSGSFFNVDLNGTTAGSGYDQVSVTGLLAISGSNLVVTVGGGLQTGNKFFVALNDGTDAVTGTFAQGSTVTASNGYTFLINYTDDGGGGLLGNDISLTLTAVPEPRTWIGPALALAAISFTQLRKHSRAGGRRIQKKLQVVG